MSRQDCRFILMRGVSGSGKSYTANLIASVVKSSGLSSVICSTDNFFLIPNKYGEIVYQFDPSKLGEYHKATRQAVEEAIKDNVNVIIVDNTNTTSFEMRDYVWMAFQGKYQIELHEPDSPWWLKFRDLIGITQEDQELELIAREFLDHTTHNVPLASIKNMLFRWQNEDKLDQDIKHFIKYSNIP